MAFRKQRRLRFTVKNLTKCIYLSSKTALTIVIVFINIYELLPNIMANFINNQYVLVKNCSNIYYINIILLKMQFNLLIFL